MTQNLIDTTFSAKNISSLVSVYEYTVLETSTIGFQVRLVAVAGGGDYSMYLTLNDGDLQTDDKVWPKITYTAATGETAFWLIYPGIDVMAGDVINVMVLGLAGDTNESGSVRIFSDNYAAAADVPTAAEIDTQLSGTHGAGTWGNGSGSTSTTVTVNDGVNPIDGVDVWVSTDSAGTNVIARGSTGALGTVVFMLDAGTYYAWKQLAGYDFTNPQSFTVS